MVLIAPVEFEKPDGGKSVTHSSSRRVLLPSAAIRAGALAAADVAAFGLALGIALLVGTQGTAALSFAALACPAGVFAAFIATAAARGHYGHCGPRLLEMRDITGAGILALLATSAVEAMLHQGVSAAVAIGWLLFIPAALLLRGFARALLHDTQVWQRRAVVVGHGAAADRAVELLRSDARRNFAVAGVVSPARIGLAGPGHWTGVLRQHQADLVVLASDHAPADILAGVAEWLVRDRVPFAVFPPVGMAPAPRPFRALPLGRNHVLWSYRDNLKRPVRRAAKLGFDVSAALALLVVLAPVLLCIAALIRMDGGPVLFAHRRVGARGQPFGCLKFRSMVVDADAVLRDVLATDPAAAAEWAETHKLRRDPRVTWIGHHLRRLSLDELPQLFNVLRLEMSLVGPRPIVTAEVPRYGDDIHHYFAARPGLTGLWQVSGRSDTGYSQRIQLDAQYVRTWSLWQDMLILARTVPAVLQRRGAV